jgi:hypothetical protein
MKIYLAIIFIAIGIMCQKLSAQEKPETLIDFSSIKTIGIYVSPEYQLGQLSGGFTNFASGSIMITINKRIAFGGTFLRSISENYSPTNVSPLLVRSEFIGGKIEYTLNPDNLIHFSFPVVAGVSRVSLDSANLEDDMWDYNDHYFKNRSLKQNNLLILQAGANAEVNLIKYAKFYIGTNYRYSTIIGNDVKVLENNINQGLSFSVGIKLGLFDFSI